ncbi:MAG: PLP-dependent aminotransferase family protein [Firmicutes bacterium]|nr:PLP-dependent aminotransferase family protein [Bacillota bacterium]
MIKPFIYDKNDNNRSHIYIQLYRHIKDEILAGNIKVGEKLPSLRSVAEDSGISVTTVGQAYDQLLTEGYIISKPQSGYYVAEIPTTAVSKKDRAAGDRPEFDDFTFDRGKLLYDLDTFDFLKWKKCAARVLNEYADMLLFESDIKGEAALRFEICKYLYSSRGVSASPEQVVIGAGSQQLTSHLARILSRMGIDMVCTEDPGYLPIQNVFRDRGFAIAKIPVTENGIMIEKLPANIPTAVYVSPANQFPTGSVMPIGARYKLLEWALENNSIILEDDYDSELRYFGKPVPALQGLDESDSVVYLGSFSSTLFPAIKISYMILPDKMVRIFDSIKGDYTQTCSKAEQLTLALFMEDGYYYTNIRKLRRLYAQKLEAVVEAFEKYGGDAAGAASDAAVAVAAAGAGDTSDTIGATNAPGAGGAAGEDGAAGCKFIEATNTKSGINITLSVASSKSETELCAIGKSLGINIVPLSQMGYTGDVTSHGGSAIISCANAINDSTDTVKNKKRHMIFYFNQIPLDEIDSRIRDLVASWCK